MEPPWGKKLREGKMFARLQCNACLARFHFTDSPRVTRFPRCPQCGGYSAQPFVA